MEFYVLVWAGLKLLSPVEQHSIDMRRNVGTDLRDILVACSGRCAILSRVSNPERCEIKCYTKLNNRFLFRI